MWELTADDALPLPLPIRLAGRMHKDGMKSVMQTSDQCQLVIRSSKDSHVCMSVGPARRGG